MSDKLDKQVSIIIPIYNCDKYLTRALESLYKSPYDTLEYIFVDDASTDNSISTLHKFLEKNQVPSENAKVILLSQNKGAANARNEGLKIATGEYIGFFDADDWVVGNPYIEMYNFATKNRLDIVWTDFYYSDGLNHNVKKQNQECNPISCIRNLLKEDLHGALWNKLYRRELFYKNNISFPIGQDYWEDLSTNVILFSKADKVGYLNKAYYYYFQENKNSLGNISLNKKINQIIFNCDRVIEYLNKNYENLFKIEINYLKLAAKQNLLFTTDIKYFYNWESIYRESSKYILKFRALPIHLRVLGFLCFLKQWWAARMYIFIKKLK